MNYETKPHKPSAFIAYMEEGTESLRKQNVYEVPKITGFEYQMNKYFAAAYAKILWKSTALFPDSTEGWIPYYNLQCGDLLKRFIED